MVRLTHHAHGGQGDAQLGGDCNLSHGCIPQTKEVTHFKFSVGQWDCFVKQFNGLLKIASLHLNRAECFVSKFTLLVQSDGLCYKLHCKAYVTLSLQCYQASVDQKIGISRIHLHPLLIQSIRSVKLLLVIQDLGIEGISFHTLGELIHRLVESCSVPDCVGSPVVSVELLHISHWEIGLQCDRFVEIHNGCIDLVDQ